MSPSLDNDCTVQDLAFQVLNPFRANSFNIRPLPSNNYVFDDLVFQDMNTSENICQDLAATGLKSCNLNGLGLFAWCSLQDEFEPDCLATYAQTFMWVHSRLEFNNLNLGSTSWS